jgi:hypothetical protein
VTRHYYSTQTFLAWCFNHYFYGPSHFAYVGAPFHTYKLPNPASSNPWLRYGSQYNPWWDDDPYDPFVRSQRTGLAAGVVAMRRARVIGRKTAKHLLVIANRAEVALFYPVVYRVDIDLLDINRLEKRGSGLLVASDEWTIRDLRPHEFDVLFFDPASDSKVDPDVTRLGAPISGGADVPLPDVLRTLMARLMP